MAESPEMTLETFLDEVEENRGRAIDRLISRSPSDPLVRHFVALGITTALRQRHHRYRVLIKKGRADEVPEPARQEEIRWQQRLEEMDADANRRLFAKVQPIIENFEKQIENSILAKWKIAGLPLGCATPEKLIEEAQAEERAAQGHADNAIFYRRLAALGASGVPLMVSVSPEQADAIGREVFGEWQGRVIAPAERNSRRISG
jgi:hypothetical protein